jgi:penicillin V acylase-like amidase (Ntn superfamily)
MRIIFDTCLLFIMMLVYNINVCSCSCISLHTRDQIIFGRNQDYFNPNSVIVYNPKNQFKTAMPYDGEKVVQWKSLYSSITVSAIGFGLANSGMNEKGLAIGHMALDETQYPQKDERPVMSSSQWILYMLDVCSNTEEVIKEADKIRISNESSKQHYFICDKNGDVAIIEFLKGKMVLYRSNNIPYHILSNDNQAQSMDEIKKFTGFGGDKTIPDRAQVTDELMTIGCNKLNQFYEKECHDIIKDAFDVLNSIRSPDSTPRFKEYGTQYSLVFDLTNMKLYFRTKTNQNIREIDFNSFDDDCIVKVKLLGIQTTGVGNVNNLFVDYTVEENRKHITDFYEKEFNKLSSEDLDWLLKYPDSFKCEK